MGNKLTAENAPHFEKMAVENYDGTKALLDTMGVNRTLPAPQDQNQGKQAESIYEKRRAENKANRK